MAFLDGISSVYVALTMPLDI